MVIVVGTSSRIRERGLGVGFVLRERGKEDSVVESGVNFRLLPLLGIVRGGKVVGVGSGLRFVG
jgi:hypothetical protein